VRTIDADKSSFVTLNVDASLDENVYDGPGDGISAADWSPFDFIGAGLGALARGVARPAATTTLVNGSKAMAMDAVKNANAPKAVIGAVQRATAGRSNVIVMQTGRAFTVTATRAGANGGQMMLTTVNAGRTTVFQVSFNRSLQIVHVDRKFP
jgi:ribosomal protein L13E